MLTADELRRVVLSLPEAEERETWGHPTFRVRDKMFATLSDDGRQATVKATREDQAALVADSITVHATPGITAAPDGALGYYTRSGATAALAGIRLLASERLTGAALLPLLLTLAAAAFWGMANIATKRAGDIDMLAFVVWASLVPPLPLLGLSLLIAALPSLRGLDDEGPAVAGAGPSPEPSGSGT